jgi:hypothetical protein
MNLLTFHQCTNIGHVRLKTSFTTHTFDRLTIGNGEILASHVSLTQYLLDILVINGSTRHDSGSDILSRCVLDLTIGGTSCVPWQQQQQERNDELLHPSTVTSRHGGACGWR